MDTPADLPPAALVDSIAAVEAAWTSVAVELGQPADVVIAATHGRRAIDNLRDLKPKLRRLTNEQMEPHVENVRPSADLQSSRDPEALQADAAFVRAPQFEKRILREADEFGDKVRSRRSSTSSSRRGSTAASRRSSSSSGANPLLSGLGGFGMSKIAVRVSSCRDSSG